MRHGIPVESIQEAEGLFCRGGAAVETRVAAEEDHFLLLSATDTVMSHIESWMDRVEAVKRVAR